MDLHERHTVHVILQRPLDYALDPDRQFLAAVDVLIHVDPNLHLGSAQFAVSAVNVMSQRTCPTDIPRSIDGTPSIGLETQQ
jgi:hypothetical protein